MRALESLIGHVTKMVISNWPTYVFSWLTKITTRKVNQLHTTTIVQDITQKPYYLHWKKRERCPIKKV